MVEPLEIQSILEKLREKTKAGRVPWREGELKGLGQFSCELENYRFVVWKSEDTYGVRMEDADGRTIFFVKVEEEIVFTEEREEIFSIVSDLYELARRKALNVPEKLASVAELLDRI